MSASQERSSDVLKVSDVAQGRLALRFKGQYTFDDLQTADDVECDWQVQPETAGLSVRGDLRGTLQLECARCLAVFPVPVAMTINERYVFNHYVDPYGREKELQVEDFFEVVDEEGELDLKDLAHQFLILESANQSTCGRPECHVLEV